MLVLIAGCGGCGNRIVYPGAEQLVVVDVAPELEQCPVVLSAIPNVRSTMSTTVGNAVRDGIRYWDLVGAHLRTSDQLSPEEQANAAAAEHIRVHGDCSQLGTEAEKQYVSGTMLAEYHFSTGDIELYLRYWSVNYIDEKGWQWATMKMAHEAGHAIGLDHVSEPDAVMYPSNTDENARADLAAADVSEYDRVWAGH